MYMSSVEEFLFVRDQFITLLCINEFFFWFDITLGRPIVYFKGSHIIIIQICRFAILFHEICAGEIQMLLTSTFKNELIMCF